MVWSCFIGDKLGPLVFVDGVINQQVYIGILEQYFLPFLIALRSEHPNIPLEFVHDNATPHTAVKTQNWLNHIVKQYNLTIMQWPPNSPDMNLIEQLWAHIKHELYRRFPDTANLKGSVQFIKSALRQRLHVIWWEIGADLLNSLVDSMPQRVEVLARARG